MKFFPFSPLYNTNIKKIFLFLVFLIIFYLGYHFIHPFGISIKTSVKKSTDQSYVMPRRFLECALKTTNEIFEAELKTSVPYTNNQKIQNRYLYIVERKCSSLLTFKNAELTKDFIDGSKSSARAYVVAFINQALHISTDPERLQTTGWVYIMPGGQKMIYTTDKKWVPCEYPILYDLKKPCIPSN